MKIRLSPKQKEVVGFGDGALLVVAGPGSGKTRVITERIRRLLKRPNEHFRVLALTFTNKAANEMVERFHDIPEIEDRAFVGTIHSFCIEVLANRGKSVGITGTPHIFESSQDRKQVLSDAVRADPDLLRALRNAGGDDKQKKLLDSWLGAIGEAKNTLKAPTLVEDDLLRRVYEAYDAGLRASSVVDFDDLLLLTYRLFEERPETARFYRRQYKYICIDEAQDLNEAQYRLLCALWGKDYFNIMMVGDPKQAIFVWNGASPKYMELFVKDFKATQFELPDNFRSSRAVVAAAQALDSSYIVEGQLPIDGEVTVQEFDDEESEAEYIVSSIQALIESGHADIEGPIVAERIAIIARNRFVFRLLEVALKAAALPYHMKVSAAGYKSESETMTEFELALRLLSNPLDRLHLGMLATCWKSTADIEEIYGSADLRSLTGPQVLAALEAKAKTGYCAITMRAVNEVRWTTEDFKLLKGLASLEKDAADVGDDERAIVLQDIAQWKKHWTYFIRSEPGGKHSVSSFLNQVALGTTQQPQQEGLSLITVHSAKGTEFEVVYLMGMTEGTFPDFRASGEALAEEHRNAFVGVTRSKRLLFVTYPLAKLMPWGDTKRQKPSRFVATIRAAQEK
jgi:DNA helicase-2/ATP-dependent DNA helicase PcrA